MVKQGLVVITLLMCYQVTCAQSSVLNRQLFFLDDKVVEVSITADLRKLKNEKNKPVWQPAEITFSDTTVITEKIGIKLRGIYRKANCDLASLMLDFKNTTSPKLSPLKKLKLLGGCHNNVRDEALLLKEYLVYKIYNIISAMSFRVRLLHITYQDSKKKAKSYTQYGFLIEDIKDLAERNNCTEAIVKKVSTEACDRRHINLVSLFQYMIGNTDWSVSVAHNIKLITPKNEPGVRPYPIPYDFDFAGVVNADYAVPAEELGTKSVTERVYRGFGRNMTELELNLDIFKEKKEQVMFYIKNFALLSENVKKEITRYLEEFYKIIDNKKLSKLIFIDRARKI